MFHFICQRLVVITDPAARDELSLCRINRYDVSTHCAYATVWSKSDAWGHSGVILVKTLERGDQLLAAQISSGAFQTFREDLRGCERIQLRCDVSRREPVFLLQRAGR